MSDPAAAIAASYDAVAAAYAQAFGDELRQKPLDCELLREFVAKANPGLIADLGCGPGQITKHLHSLGANVCGADLSPEMIRLARALNPTLTFHVCDLRALTPFATGSVDAALAYYAILNLPRPDVPAALREIARVLRPGGALLLSYHVGGESSRKTEWWGRQVDLEFHQFQSAMLASLVQFAGFTQVETIERDPYPQIELPVRRGFLKAQRGG